MAYPYTRSRERSEVPDSDVEPSEIAPSAATSPPPVMFVGPQVEAVEGSESLSAEPTGPVSAPTLFPLVAGPPCTGSHGILGSAGPSQVGVSALGYPSGLADPPDSSMYTGGQMSTSLATGIVAAEVHAELELSSTSRQPPATASAAQLPLEGPTIILSHHLGLSYFPLKRCDPT